MIAKLENKTVKNLLCAGYSRRCPLLDYTVFRLWAYDGPLLYFLPLIN